MRLAQALAPQVPHRSRARGTSYFASGAVTSIAAENGIVHATVEGTDTYDVFLEPGGREIRASCTCPYFFDHIEICKHIWAAILAAESKHVPLAGAGTALGRIALLPVHPDDDLEDFDGDTPGDDPEDFEDFRNFEDVEDLDYLLPRSLDGVRPTGGRGKGTRARKAPEPWQHLLAAAMGAPSQAVDRYEATAPAPAPGALLYVLDVTASKANGILVVELMTRDRKMNGEWGKPRPARLMPGALDAMPDGEDRRIVERLAGARPDVGGPYSSSPYASIGYELSRFRLAGILAAEVLPPMCATGRCVARMEPPPPPPAPTPPASGGARAELERVEWMWSRRQAPSPPPTLAPLAWDDGPPWRFVMSVTRDEAAGVYHVGGSLVRDSSRMDVSMPLLVLADGALVTDAHVARLDHSGAFAWLRGLRATGAVTIPLGERDRVIDAFLTRPPALDMVPDELRVDIVPGVPRPCIRLRPARGRGDRLEATLTFSYDQVEVAASDPGALVRVAGVPRAITRDLDAEHAYTARLHPLGFRQEWAQYDGGRALHLPAHLLPKTVRTLLDEGWHVEAGGRAYRSPGVMSVSVASGIDWFDLQGYADYGDQRAALPALLAAADRGESFVTLDDGTVGLLPEEWLRRHGLVARLGTRTADGVRFTRSQTGLLDALLAAQPEATCDETFARARRELQAFDGIAPADPHSSFTGTLRPYQRDGLGWLAFLQRFGFGGCLADDMGLGKTVQVLALLATRCASQQRNGTPSLVVAPRSLVFNWREEAARFAPSLRVLDYTGARRAEQREAFAHADIVLTTYGTLRRDAAHLQDVVFDYVVLDEAQAVKNAGSASAKAVRLLKADHRLALSGTPVENHLGELWSLFDFLNPGLLGRSAAFAAAGPRRELDADTLATLARGLKPFILRRTKAQVAPELPPRSEQTIYCELEKAQRTSYNELRDHYRSALLAKVDRIGLKRAAFQVLEALLRLRQAACHPALIDPKRRKDGSAKLDTLLAQLEEVIDEGHKVLVFSQFTSFLALVRERLDAQGSEYEYLDGKTRDRQTRVERFQSDASCRLFLISLKAGGLGLNLPAADYVFLLDPWWNPAVEAQAIDRAHRIGQERHVLAYRLIAKNTVEERVLELQQRKRQIADAILAGDGTPLRDLRREDLELLLS